MAQNIPLLPGEEIVFQLEGDVFGGGANPISQAIARINAFVSKILGTKIKATLVVTTQRVIEYREVINCWCVPVSRDFKVVLPHSIKEVGYHRVTTCGCFPYFALYYQSMTQSTFFPVKDGSDEQLAGYVEKFYKAMKA